MSIYTIKKSELMQHNYYFEIEAESEEWETETTEESPWHLPDTTTYEITETNDN